MILKKERKKRVAASKTFNKKILDDERAMRVEYGLRNKKELHRVYYKIAQYRKTYFAHERKKIQHIRARLIARAVITAQESILSLSVRKFLERRLQTVIYKKFSSINSPKHARQLIVSGHVICDNAYTARKVKKPGHMVRVMYENSIKVLNKNSVKALNSSE